MCQQHASVVVSVIVVAAVVAFKVVAAVFVDAAVVVAIGDVDAAVVLLLLCYCCYALNSIVVYLKSPCRRRKHRIRRTCFAKYPCVPKIASLEAQKKRTKNTLGQILLCA